MSTHLRDELAEKYADSHMAHNKRPPIQSSYALNRNLRELWESKKETFIAGWNAAEARQKERAQRLLDALIMYANRDNWGTFDTGGVIESTGNVHDTKFIPSEIPWEIAKEAVEEFTKGEK